MKKTVMAGAVVAFVILAFAGTYAIAYEPASDYTLLDSMDNIQPGLTCKMNENMSDWSRSSSTVVKEVDGDVGVFSQEFREEALIFQDGMYVIWEFDPGFFDFDYTDEEEIPESVSVSVSGNEYTLNGSYNDGMNNATYRSLRIVVEDGEAVDVSGALKYDYEGKNLSEHCDIECKTEGGVLLVKGTVTEKAQCTEEIDYFWDMALNYFVPEDYSELDITESDEKCGNVTAHVYTMNGEMYGHTFENLKCYTYQGYTLKITGVYDGGSVRGIASVYMA